MRRKVAKLKSFAKATVANAGSPRRARISRKPLRREGRSVSACTCGHRARANSLCAAAPGAAATRPSLRPLHFGEGDGRCKARAKRAARTRTYVFTVIARSVSDDRVRRSALARRRKAARVALDCFARARNDGVCCWRSEFSLRRRPGLVRNCAGGPGPIPRNPTVAFGGG